MALFLEGDGFEGSRRGGILQAGCILFKEALAFVFALEGVFKYFANVHVDSSCLMGLEALNSQATIRLSRLIELFD